ncbi:MAG: NYN domain-containing protein [Nitrospirae bacterium]|nr:NYN domain-containing protein [Nitrospirota bacterium]
MAVKIIIDGYNLIGTHHSDLKAQRTKLINDLSLYGRRKGHDMTVVFDGIRDGFNRTRTVIGSVIVIYSGRGESADDVIKEIIGRAGLAFIVVSTDRAIASFAWSKNCTPVRSEDFYRKLYPAHEVMEEVPVEYDEDDDETTSASRKGSSWVLSKKDKMVKQALDKL